jgi:hypothetical protein
MPIQVAIFWQLAAHRRQASVHSLSPTRLTIRGALFADFGAFATGEFVKFRAEQACADVRQMSAQAIIKVKCLARY